MRALKFIAATLAIITFVSCEKVINVELNEADRVYVVDGFISNMEDQNYIKISKSDNFYAIGDFEKISGATVVITDQDNNSVTFTELEPGYYALPGFVASSYKTYDLQISINDEVITARTTMPGNTTIDSIPYQENQGGFFGDGYTAFLYWFDKGNETNYYKLTNYKKSIGEQYYQGDTDISITNDQLSNGIPTGIPLFTSTFELGDSVIVDLIEIDQHNYYYWYALSQVVSGQSAAPGNPISNLSGNTLGYFGAYNISRDTIVIE